MRLSTKVLAVTGLHRGDNPQPGAAVIRSLRRKYPDLRIVGLSYDPLESGLYSHDIDYVDAAYSLPFPGNGSHCLLERLTTIIEQEPLDFIVPSLDSEIANFIDIAQELLQLGVQLSVPTKKSLESRSKPNLDEFCKKHKVHYPRTALEYDLGLLTRAAEAIGYPIYVKGKFYEAYLVHSEAELIHKATELMEMWGGPVLVQEVIIGEEYVYTGIGDGNGELLGHCSIRKMLLNKAGKGFAGVVVADPDLDKIANNIIRKLKWNGPVELEFIKPSNGPHMLIEINPRFPAWIDFPSQLGCNLPAQLLSWVYGSDDVSVQNCPPGKLFVRHNIDLVGDMSELAQMVTAGSMVNKQHIKELEIVR